MCWHNWSKWQTTEKGKIFTKNYLYGGSPVHTGHYLVQQRVCEKCGKIKLRTVETE